MLLQKLGSSSGLIKFSRARPGFLQLQLSSVSSSYVLRALPHFQLPSTLQNIALNSRRNWNANFSSCKPLLARDPVHSLRFPPNAVNSHFFQSASSPALTGSKVRFSGPFSSLPDSSEPFWQDLAAWSQLTRKWSTWRPKAPGGRRASWNSASPSESGSIPSTPLPQGRVRTCSV